MLRRFVTILLLTAAASPYAFAQIVRIDEAEFCKLTCAAGKDPGETIWASGGRVVPAYWGRQPGDAVQWMASISREYPDLRLAVRYSYASEHFRRYGGVENPKRTLDLVVDDRADKPIPVPVPDTGWWDLFKTSSVELPLLKKGRHTFKILSSQPNMVTNLDCFILYRGPVEKLPPNLRGTILTACTPASSPADSKPVANFDIRATPRAITRITPEQICTDFQRICRYYQDYMGWAPPPFAIHIIEDRKWPSPGATAFQNGAGVFFRASIMHREQGNWCHEMTHEFYVAHFPGWWDDSSAQALTIFNFVPALFGNYPSARDSAATIQRFTKAAREFLANGQMTDDLLLIQCAIRVKYGPDVFKRFFHLCHQAGQKKELDFTPGRHLTKAEICKYMSLAAGEDVTPLYARSKGFRDATRPAPV